MVIHRPTAVYFEMQRNYRWEMQLHLSKETHRGLKQPAVFKISSLPKAAHTSCLIPGIIKENTQTASTSCRNNTCPKSSTLPGSRKSHYLPLLTDTLTLQNMFCVLARTEHHEKGCVCVGQCWLSITVTATKKNKNKTGKSFRKSFLLDMMI